jgi:hypothetical protein
MERLGATKFPQDCTPCHTNKKVMALLKKKQISVMDWPGNSQTSILLKTFGPS